MLAHRLGKSRGCIDPGVHVEAGELRVCVCAAWVRACVCVCVHAGCGTELWIRVDILNTEREKRERPFSLYSLTTFTCIH